MDSIFMYSLQTEFAIGVFLFVVIEYLGFYLYKWLKMKNQRRIWKKKNPSNNLPFIENWMKERWDVITHL